MLSLFVLATFLRSPVEAGEYADGLLDRAAVIEAATNIDQRRFPNSDHVLVDKHVLTRYRPDGTSESWDDTVVKVLTEKGRRGYGARSFYFTIPYTEINVPKLEIIRPTGEVVPIDVAGQSREMVNPGTMSSNIYNPNHKVLKINVPGLEIGDMLRSVVHRDNVKARVRDAWSSKWLVESTRPIVRVVIELDAPRELPLIHRRIRDELPGTVTYTESETERGIKHRWEVRDVPRVFREPDMPSFYTVLQRIVVSTIPDWPTVSRSYWAICEPRLQATNQEMNAKVAELVEELPDDEAKMEAIFYWVAQKIRYMGITTEEEAPGYEPHDVSMTFNNKYGVCRDKAALLVAMLREAGIEAFPVLIMKGRKKDSEVPDRIFNHAIVAARLDGEYHLMDPTDENTRSLLPAYLCDCSYLVATPEGDILRTSPIIPATENLMEISSDMELNGNGRLIGETILDFGGINDGRYRGALARMKPADRRRAFERIIKRVVTGAELVDFTLRPEDIQDTSVPLRIELRYLAQDVAIRGSGKLMLPLPWMGTAVGMAKSILGQTSLEKREYPMKTDYACGVHERLSIRLSEDFGAPLSLPEYPSIDTEAITWQREIALRGNTLCGENTFLMKVVEFSPDQYLELKRVLRDVEFNSRKMPLFGDGETLRPDRDFTEDTDVAILSHEVECDILGEHGWVRTDQVRKEIFTYAGKKRSSELKIHFNPAWETVELLSAEVVGKDGTRKTISEQELNLMDAAWVGSAPRYPPGRILVASLPGVEVGSVIEYALKREYRHQPFFGLRQVFKGRDPVVSRRLTVRNAKNLPLRLLDMDGSERNVTDSELVWVHRNAAALRSESSLPPEWTYLPHITLSGGNWQGYAGQLNAVLREASANQPETVKQAGVVTSGVKSRRGKVIAIRDFVARRIRYAGPSLSSLPFTAITPADSTLADAYGNSADRAVLLAGMLEAIGLQPEFVLVGGYPDVKEVTDELRQYPLPGIWDGVLVAVDIEGETVYLNDTDQYGELGTTPHSDQWSLHLGKGDFIRIRALPGHENRSDRVWRIAVNPDGSAQLTREETISGSDFGTLKRVYGEMRPEAYRRHVQELVSGISQEAELVGEMKTDFTEYPGRREITVSIPRYAVREDDRLYLILPEAANGLRGLGSDRRENPLYWPSPVRGSKTFHLSFSDASEWKPSIRPAPALYELPGETGTVLIKTDSPEDTAHGISIVHNINLRPVIHPVTDYEVLKVVDRQLSHPDNRMILLEK